MQTEQQTTGGRQEDQYNEADDRYEYYYDDEGTVTLPTMLVHALASVADVDVSQGEFSLYDSVDPDALERIFSEKGDGSSRTGGHVAFTALEHEVYVYADGTVYIHPPEHETRPRPAGTSEPSSEPKPSTSSE